MSRRAINHITKIRASHKERDSKKNINGTKLFRPSKKKSYLSCQTIYLSTEKIFHIQ